MNQILRGLKPLLLTLLVLSGHFIGLASPGGAPHYPGGYDSPGSRGFRIVAEDGSCPVRLPLPVVPVTSVYDSRNTSIAVYQASLSITFESGFATAPGDAFIAEIVPGTSGVPQATNLTGTPDANINWIQSSAFDENGNLIGDSRKYYDNAGQSLQTQGKVFYRANVSTTYTHVLASQPIKDAYGRPAASTMLAPINYADFSYQPNFLQYNGTSVDYSHENFDLYNNGSTNTDKTNSPDPLYSAGATLTPGTLAWYYSPLNSWEPYTPVTAYPYVRQSYYQDGTGNTKKSAVSGEQLIMGTGREASGYQLPVADELDFYVQVRNQLFSTTQVGALPASLQSQSTQTISHDRNGFEVMAIQDVAGHTLMTARQGTGLAVSNTVTVGATGSGLTTMYYFKLLSAGAVNVTGGSFTLYDMNTELPVPGFISGNTLATGYYKLVNTGTASLTLNYANSYMDVSYSFYDQKGQLVARIAPNGTKSLYGSPGLSSYSSITAVPFAYQNTYDPRGRLISSQDPDGGLSQIIYRNDGAVRFSQNAVQAGAGTYSYTNYDPYGRVIESGQYLQTDGITFGSAPMTAILENTTPTGGLVAGTKTDVMTNQFDLPDITYSSNTGNNAIWANYVQDPFNLAGAVSVTRRYSSVVNNSPSTTYLVSATWYNYDVYGNQLWQIQYISGMGAGIADINSYKTTDYTYDPMNNLTKKIFQAHTPAETFVHYFNYDPANYQLWHVYTNTVDNPATETLQATYYYYLHGGLKRVEVGGNLQGIDYTYTLQGSLKAINNSNSAQDPGGDAPTTNGFGADAFGEELDYFTGDYANSRTGIAAVTGVTAPAPTADSYAGNIKAMSWFSIKPPSVGGSPAPNAYAYQYDPKYRFIGAAWGAVTFSGTMTPATFAPTQTFGETVGNTTTTPYDGNGNIQFLQRTGATASQVTDAFSYQYGSGNNQLTAVANTLSPGQNYAAYQYDANGRVVKETTASGAVLNLSYDAEDKLTTVTQGAALTPVVSFTYDEEGRRIRKLSYNSSGQLMQVTFYVGDVIYTQSVTNGTTYGAVTATEYLIRGLDRIGEYLPTVSPAIYAYELKDHLGNVRAVVAQSSTSYTVRTSADYYPFGGVINPGGTTYRFDYQGQFSEKDPETGWNAFALRMYDSRIGRWLQYDQAGQFYSPYLGMGDNPVSGIDSTGGFDTWFGAFLYNAFSDNGYGDIVNNGKEWLVNDIEGDHTVTASKWAGNHNLAYNIWNSPVIRSKTPDFLNIGVGWNAFAIIGNSTSGEINFVLHGPGASWKPILTTTVGVGGGYSIDATFNIGVASYTGDAENITRQMVGTNSFKGENPTVWGGGGVAAGGRIGVTGSVTKLNGSPEVIAGAQLNIGAGLPAGALPFNGAFGTSNTFIIKDWN